MFLVLVAVIITDMTVVSALVLGLGLVLVAPVTIVAVAAVAAVVGMTIESLGRLLEWKIKLKNK